MRYSSALTPALLAAAIACGSERVSAPEFPALPEGAVAVEFSQMEQVHTTSLSGIADRRRIAIRTQEEWEAFWSEFTGTVQPQPPAPVVDFGTQMILAATMGTRNTGGFAVSVEGVFEAEGRLIAQVLERSPAQGCIVTQSLTAPATAVVVARRDGAVEFQEAAMASECN
jgi:hypothetical protein